MSRSLELRGRTVEEELKHSWYDWHLAVWGHLPEKTTTYEGLRITFRRLEFIPRTTQLDEWGVGNWKGAEGPQGLWEQSLEALGAKPEPYPSFSGGLKELRTSSAALVVLLISLPPLPFYLHPDLPLGKRDEVKIYIWFMISCHTLISTCTDRNVHNLPKGQRDAAETLPPPRLSCMTSFSSSGYFRCLF